MEIEYRDVSLQPGVITTPTAGDPEPVK
jgi:hypothetical protein